jgi:predicted methyltransferase
VTIGSVTNPPRLFGISTRMGVLTADNVMIAGFIIGGPVAKTVVVRARGPSLGVAGSLQDPTMTIVPANGNPNLVNDNWQTDPNAAALQASGFAPTDARESAIMVTLAPGAYTAIISGVANTTGVAIVEVYELDHPEVPMIGISTRGFVQTNDLVMIGGFIIQGSGPQTVVVRARGPSLGVAGSLLDPTLTIVPADGSPTKFNDNWQTDPNAAALQASGFAPTDSRESAILITLNPGAYTAIVSGAANTTGVAIIEVYTQ